MNEIFKYNDIAFKDPEFIRQVQQEKLKKHLDYCVKNSPFYKKRLKPNVADIDLNDLSQLCFTEKSDLEKHNDDFCCVRPSQIRDVVFSSGTTGIPTKVMYTEKDLRRLAYNEKKSFTECGISSEDISILTCTLDRCFIAGLAYFLGMREIGATSIRNGHGTLAGHTEVIKRMNPTVIVGVPTFLRKLGLFLKEKGICPKSSTVSKLVCIGEPLRGRDFKPLKVAGDIEEIWNAKAVSTYASSETITTFCECTAQSGGHLHPDLAIIEIVDENGNLLPAGEIGQVVVTPLEIEGMPLVRFKTGDVSFLIDEPCKCGRKSVRLGPILGRKKQMMKIRGTTVYPQAIYSALEEVEGIIDYFLTVNKHADLSDEVVVTAAVNDDSCKAEFIQEVLQSRIRIKPEVEIKNEKFVKENVYTPKSRKPVRFIDKR